MAERVPGLVRAADARLPVLEGGKLLRKLFPDHWSFLLGELALYSFVLLLLTGVWLTFFFHPSMHEVVYNGSYTPLLGVRMSEAYQSTLDITFDVRGGLLVRQIHHWAALLFVSALGVHMLRVFFTGAFRRPRELNWSVGVLLFLTAVLEGFAGYSLPDDLLSGTGLRTAEGIVLSVPLVGTYLAMFVFGGQFPGTSIVPRLYAMHILLIPGLLLALITVHLILVFYLQHTQWPRPGRRQRNVVGIPMFPQFAARSIGLMFTLFGVVAVLSAVAQINPIWVYGPYQPDQASTNAQPDWYVGFLEGALRLMPGVETRFAGHTVSWSVFLPALVLPGLLAVILLAYPFVERWVTGDGREHNLCDRPRDRPTRTGLGVAAIIAYGVLLLAGGQDVISDALAVSVNELNWVLRVCFLLLPVAAFVVTKRICIGLQLHERELLTEGAETGLIRQDLAGGFDEPNRPLSAQQAWVMLPREPPGKVGAGPRGRFGRALRTWYFRGQVALPARDEIVVRRPSAPAGEPPRTGASSQDAQESER
ncbi:cytochrome bc1 complex cytochrome b subunit [Streptacidiphilus anmyonensis]|uniref:cytochrome bc1 complex cytochrome b subunit n=1 Tax=Streptacidiphilus anmyonensis TaxID=405782 RepID=UPI0005A77BC1|nr:cytochrome bc complex cytochrome b subunit [Streptacidiphilus anmyonensis]